MNKEKQIFYKVGENKDIDNLIDQTKEIERIKNDFFNKYAEFVIKKTIWSRRLTDKINKFKNIKIPSSYALNLEEGIIHSFME